MEMAALSELLLHEGTARNQLGISRTSTDEARAAVGRFLIHMIGCYLADEALRLLSRQRRVFLLRSFTSPFTPSPIVIQIMPR